MAKEIEPTKLGEQSFFSKGDVTRNDAGGITDGQLADEAFKGLGNFEESQRSGFATDPWATGAGEPSAPGEGKITSP